MTLFTDAVQGGLERALDATSLRSQVTADNLANAMTPGYKARRVEFEGALAAAMRSGRPESADVSVVDAGTPVREDGNSVLVEEETMQQMRTSLQYQALVEATAYKFGLLRSAIEGR